MIYILDNGLRYSDHCIAFVSSLEIPEGMEYILELIRSTKHYSEDKWKMIGATPSIEWRDKDQTCTVAQWFPIDVLEDHPELLPKMPNGFWREVLTVNDERNIWIDPTMRASIEAHLRS